MDHATLEKRLNLLRQRAEDLSSFSARHVLAERAHDRAERILRRDVPGQSNATADVFDDQGRGALLLGVADFDHDVPPSSKRITPGAR
jgi:hypothetical protein